MMDWVIKNPDDVFPRIFPLVGELADKGDAFPASCSPMPRARWASWCAAWWKA